MRGRQVKYLPSELGRLSSRLADSPARPATKMATREEFEETASGGSNQVNCSQVKKKSKQKHRKHRKTAQAGCHIKLPVSRASALLCIVLLHNCLAGQQTTLTSEASASELMEPRITIQPNDLIVIEGESTELNCDAEGQPAPIIEWYHNGVFISSSTPTRTTMGGSIQFLDIRPAQASGAAGAVATVANELRPSDTGTYYCLAKNSLGTAKSRNASLQVACKYTFTIKSTS